VYRVFVGGLKHESNSFSSLITSIKDFTVLSPSEVLEKEYSTYLRNTGFEVVSTIVAYAPPAGLVEKHAYLELKERILQDLEKAKKLDGVYLDLHGAMEVKDLGSGELDLVKSIREIVGYDIPISASFDLHGNIPAELVEELDILVAYRTAPHVDAEETRLKAVSLLAKQIKKKVNTSRAIVKPPMLLPGEYFVTLFEPASSIMKLLPEIDSKPEIVVSSLFVGCAWTDAPYSTPSAVIVASENNYEKALLEAKRLAQEVWRKRKKYRLDVEAGEPEEIVDKALQSIKKPVVISDSGDNVTAGGGGDVPLMLDILLRKNASKVLVAGLFDIESFKKCREAGEGSKVELVLGGKIDKIYGYPLEVEAKVMKTTEEEVLIRVKKVDVIVSSKRKPYISLEDYAPLKIDPKNYNIVVVKLGYLFSDIRKLAAVAYMALTPGFTYLKIEELPYSKVKRPIYPLDKDFEWTP